VIVYGLEKNIAFARSKGYIFAAQCVWWLALIIELEQGLIAHINNLWSRSEKVNRDIQEELQEISLVPRDLAEDQQAKQILDRAERFIETSEQTRNQWQLN
jgi:hypothetical protein